jgi:cell division protein FtsI/penicillin-binding protein 2
VAERGESTVTNGDLLTLAENNNYDPLITTDQNLRYQQNLKNRDIAILVMMGTSWPRMQRKIATIQSAVETITQGGYHELSLS